jgi:hypothetical protein
MLRIENWKISIGIVLSYGFMCFIEAYRNFAKRCVGSVAIN